MLPACRSPAGAVKVTHGSSLPELCPFRAWKGRPGRAVTCGLWGPREARSNSYGNQATCRARCAGPTCGHLAALPRCPSPALSPKGELASGNPSFGLRPCSPREVPGRVCAFQKPVDTGISNGICELQREERETGRQCNQQPRRSGRQAELKRDSRWPGSL